MRIYFVRSVRIYLVCSAFYFVRCVTSCYMEEYHQERCVPYGLPYSLTSFMHRAIDCHAFHSYWSRTDHQPKWNIYTWLPTRQGHNSARLQASQRTNVIGTGLQTYFNPATNDVLERFVEGEIWTIWRVDQL